MAKRSAAETTEWIAEKLREADKISKVEVLSDRILRVSRDEHEPYIAGIVSSLRVKSLDIESIVNSEFDVQIIANVPKEAIWTGEAIKLAEVNNIATGAFADLYRVIDLGDVRTYKHKNIEFIERSLRQHSRVIDFDRVHDRLYSIERNGYSDLTAVMLHEYELTSNHLRTALDRYGEFSIVVITDPNGSATSSAKDAAAEMGVEIHKWGTFLGRLNRK